MIKNIFIKFNMALILIMILFANLTVIVFAEDDYEGAIKQVEEFIVNLKDDAIGYSSVYYADEDKSRDVLYINFDTADTSNLNSIAKSYGFSSIEIESNGSIKFYKDGNNVKTFVMSYGYENEKGEIISYTADDRSTMPSYLTNYGNQQGWSGTTVSFAAAEHDLQISDLVKVSSSNIYNKSMIFYEDQEQDASKKIETISSRIYSDESGKMTFRKIENEYTGEVITVRENETVEVTEKDDDGKHWIVVDDTGNYTVIGGWLYDVKGNEVHTNEKYDDGKIQKELVHLEKGERYYSLSEVTLTKSEYAIEEGTEAEFEAETEVEKEWNDDGEDHPELYEIIISWFIRLIGKGLQALTSLVAGEELSIDKLVFDQYSRTNLFIFKRDADKYGSNTMVSGALDALNEVFSLFSKIAIVSYLIILIYMGIRMLTLSTSPDKRAKYKELLFDWIKGLIILYFFPYVMRYTILLNHAFVTYLYDESVKLKIDVQGASIKANDGGLAGIATSDYKVIESSSGMEEGSEDTKYVEDMSGGDGYMVEMYKTAEKSKRIADAICWVIMLMQVLQFLIVYMKRLITVIFLIAIFPLVSISYALDKIGDGKSQAFNNWTKEFILQVFVQSFHAVNYVLIMGIVLNLSNDNWFLKIIGITYVAKGGDILRGLFAQMKGGTGKDGGVLNVAQSMIKARMAISGVKAIGGVASRTFGRNSMLGHGVGMISNARNTALERKANRVAIRANEIYSDPNVPVYADGTLKKPLDSTIENRINRVLEPEGTHRELTREQERREYQNNLEELARLSPEDIQRVLNGMNLDKNQKEFIEDAILAVGVHDIIKNRKRKSNVDVRTAVDMEIKYRTQPVGTNPYIDRYLDIGNKEFNDKQIKNLKKINAANSFTINNSTAGIGSTKLEVTEQNKKLVQDAVKGWRKTLEEKNPSRVELDNYMQTILAATGNTELEQTMSKAVEELPSMQDEDGNKVDISKLFRERRVDYSIEAFRDAYQGKSVEEMDNHYQAIEYMRPQMNAYIKNQEDTKLNFTIGDFKKNMEVQIVNHSHDMNADFERTNEAIRFLKDSDNRMEREKEIISGLRANIDDLQENILPELRPVQNESDRVEQKAKRDMARLSEIEMLGRNTPEYIQYLRERDSELTSKFRKELTRGIATTVGGAALSTVKIGPDVAIAGIATGATASGKSGNVLEDVMTIVPNAVSATDNVMHKVGSLPSRAISSASTSVLKDGKVEDLNTIKQSMKINEKYYRDQAALENVNRKISDAELERKRLLNKINEKAGKK